MAVLTVSAIFIYSEGNGAFFLVNGADGKWLFPVDAEESLIVAGPLGNTVVLINGGSARIVSSPCKNQSCVVQGAIHGRGAWTACLPNRVMITVEEDGSRSAKDTGIDAAVW